MPDRHSPPLPRHSRPDRPEPTNPSSRHPAQPQRPPDRRDLPRPRPRPRPERGRGRGRGRGTCDRGSFGDRHPPAPAQPGNQDQPPQTCARSRHDC